MKIAGIDYSMSTPAICVYNIDEDNKKKFDFDSCKISYLTRVIKYQGFSYSNTICGDPHIPYSNDIQRFTNIASWACDVLRQCDRVMIEDYSMGSKGRVFNIAENTGILKYFLHTKEIPYETVAPTQVKKFATGKGNSPKDEMVAAFLKETGVDLCKGLTPDAQRIVSPVSDIVDSYYICKYLYESITNFSD